MSDANSYLTQSGYEKLVKELEYLKNVRRKEITQEIAKARSFGDISENAEYDAARDAQAHNEKRINELEMKLSGVRIIENENIATDEILIGATVLLEDLDNGENLKYTLVSEMEADYDTGKIAITTPVARGLLNHKVGDIIEINIPAGILKYKVLKITRE